MNDHDFFKCDFSRGFAAKNVIDNPFLSTTGHKLVINEPDANPPSTVTVFNLKKSKNKNVVAIPDHVVIITSLFNAHFVTKQAIGLLMQIDADTNELH